MNFFVYLVYISLIGSIRLYKYLEFCILVLVEPFLKIKGKELAETIGVILHCPNDPENSSNEIASKSNQKSETDTICNYSKQVHIKVNSIRFFSRVANLGDLAFGETYVDGTWDICSDDFEELTEIGLRAFDRNFSDMYYNPWNKLLEWIELQAFNLQSGDRVFQVGRVHYDLGTDLFETMLDPLLQYSCGYWKDATNLNEAQKHKMDLLARKLDLKPDMSVLDIGCGYGNFCKFLTENYGVKCVGITVGEIGATYGKQICAGLPVEFRVQDYRLLDEKFDRIISVEMFEHVGFHNYKEFFKVCHRCLKEDGIFVLQTTARSHGSIRRSDPWANKYIYPNCSFPKPLDIVKETEDLFLIQDWHNLGYDYAKTLESWRENFIKGWPKIKDKYGGDRFFRTRVFFLSFARALFKSGKAQSWQVVMSKYGLKREYRAAR